MKGFKKEDLKLLKQKNKNENKTGNKRLNTLAYEMKHSSNIRLKSRYGHYKQG